MSTRIEYTAEAIQDWLILQLAESLKINSESVDVREPFASYGLNSVRAVTISGDLEILLQRKLSPTLLWEYPCIEQLTSYLLEDREGVTTNR
ncbi:MAG TPA: acyl carrier protein [Pyrinomonadaceae bacterium]